MTAVVRMAVNGCPLLLADLLISGPPLPGAEAILPSGVAERHDVSLDRSAKGLRQKIAVITDKVVVGWAGRMTTAQDIVNELIFLRETEDLTYELLMEVFERQRESVWKEIGIVGYAKSATKPGVLKAFGRSSFSMSSTTFGQVSFLGSGIKTFADYVRENNAVAEGDPLNPPLQALHYALQMSGRLLDDEIINKTCQPHLFGGGYEIAVNADRKFIKPDFVTYLHWIGRYEQETPITIYGYPHRAFRYAYYDDLLVIRALSRTAGSAGQSLGEDRTFPVPPIYRYLTKEEMANPPHPSLNAKLLCNYVHVSSLSLPSALFCFQVHSSDECDKISFVDDVDAVKVRVNRAFAQHIADFVGGALGKNCEIRA